MVEEEGEAREAGEVELKLLKDLDDEMGTRYGNIGPD